MLSDIASGVFFGATLLTIAIGLTYFLACAGAGLLEMRAAAKAGPDSAAVARRDPDQEWVYFLVPALNESLVIEQTVRALRRTPNSTIVVIDDGSDDGTGDIARQAGGDRVILVRRTPPNARQGKGEALNHGFEAVLADVAARGLDPQLVFVCVMDADGRLSVNAWSYVLPLFDDPKVGGVQLAVKIRNPHKLITRVQDFEFWGLSAVSQFGRRRSRTVSLGGNGQFSRLRALIDLSRDPWSQSLTEDLDLAITLLGAGWDLDSTTMAWVDQQGVTEYARLIKQRTRWFQGHMTAGKRLPEIWRNHRLSNTAVLEVTLYLAIPWIIVLPWSLLFHIGLAVSVTQVMADPNAIFGTSTMSHVLIGFVLYVASFLPCLVSGYLYFRRERHYGFWRSLLLGHVLIVWNYVAFIACWQALGRMLQGRTGWDKTARSAEDTAAEVPASTDARATRPTRHPSLRGRAARLGAALPPRTAEDSMRP
ncbi:glycosyltransferase family 2 protein [Lentzea roselyniae]|uniref:Glycosyltransferase family 2 protein n=1 Tax=Lentzea roselyniae TaxID=531940 RepID=A0ABP7B1L3_9PSEU